MSKMPEWIYTILPLYTIQRLSNIQNIQFQLEYVLIDREMEFIQYKP